MVTPPLSRRALLRRAAAGAALTAWGGLLAACGADDEPAERPVPVGRAASVGRIVSLGQEDELLALGVRPVAAGVTLSGEFAPHLQRALRGVPSVGPSFEPSLERILAARPQRIFSDEFVEESLGDDLRRIARLHVVRSPVEGGVEGVASVLRQTAGPLGLRARADERLGVHRERMAAARERLAGVRGTVAFLRVRPDEVRLVTPDWGYIGPVLHGDLGLEPAPYVREVAPRDRERVGYVDLSLERIPRIDADHLLFLAEDDEALTRVERLWDRVPAVRAGSLHRVDAVVWQTTAVQANERKAADAVAALA
jgi:ABC-type Fe3+-hydroxamate transport system substrate-binding protein